ncbi:MAG: diacylglycerol kinase family lipid kinase [Coprococcus sp.]|nr:diacylglycerol kinase family lipid kinase [Coprococcus sp.]
MKKMLFIMNPKAGRTTLKNSLVDVLEVFCNHDYAVRTYITKSADDAEQIVCEEGSDYDVIVCAGGDGTLGNTVTGFMKSNLKVPLGYIPCGSTNDFAKSMDIPREAVGAAEMIVKADPFSIDIGSLNDKHFVYVAAFGIFSDTSYATPQNMKNIFGHAAYVLQGMMSLTNMPSYKLKVTVDGEEQEGEFMFGMVSNSVSIGGFRSITRKGVEFDDGLFEGLLIRTMKTPADLERVVRALLTGDVNEKNMVSFRAHRVKVESEEPIAWTCDGEYGGEYTETKIHIHRKAVDMLVVQESEEI